MNDKTTTSTPEQIRHRVRAMPRPSSPQEWRSPWVDGKAWVTGRAVRQRENAAPGLRALTELDQVIADLTVARDDLNAALAANADLPAEG